MTQRPAWGLVPAGMLAIAFSLSGCTNSGATGDGSNSPITLTVATFGEFGYKPLFDEYQKLHPSITVRSRITDFDTHHKTLATQLAAGRGAADVTAIEEQNLPQFRQVKDKFVNLAEYGAADLRNQWVPWKWDQGTADDGRLVLGLGTDMGGLAMCYRRDYFQAAGLPTDRAEVAKLWPTWQAYAQVADRFSAVDPSVKFADSAGNIYQSIIDQADESYFARSDDSFIADRNPNVETAFRLAGTISAKHQTANVEPFTQAWNVAIKRGSFATMTCPAWMLEQLRTAGGPENAGKWDITTIPGGGGNRGGSYLAVPKQGAHTRESYELAKWLTAPAQQKKLFNKADILSSEPAVYKDPEVLAFTDGYFHDAPIGQIYASSADDLKPLYRGTRDATARPVFGHALGRVTEGKQTIDEAWASAVKEARDALH